ncbi:MAG: XapX domain-containing protein [Firmicutes bacterium]|nr:XapX domain-containing protein [Bacillota bacterium]
MRELIISLLVGMAIGVVFAAMGLPLPAPGKLAGVLGIVGIFLGDKLAHMLLRLR